MKLVKDEERKTYPTKNGDEVYSFMDILKRDDILNTAEELYLMISHMKSVGKGDRASDPKYKKDLLHILSNVKIQIIKTAELHGGVLPKRHVERFENMLLAVYVRATDLNEKGEQRKIGGLVGLILKLFKLIQSIFKKNRNSDKI